MAVGAAGRGGHDGKCDGPATGDWGVKAAGAGGNAGTDGEVEGALKAGTDGKTGGGCYATTRANTPTCYQARPTGPNVSPTNRVEDLLGA